MCMCILILYASVLVVFVVFCMHMYSFASLIRRMPPPTFCDTAITDRHSETTIFQLRAHWVRISWSIASEKSFGHVPLVGVEPSCKASTLSTRPGSPLFVLFEGKCFKFFYEFVYGVFKVGLNTQQNSPAAHVLLYNIPLQN